MAKDENSFKAVESDLDTSSEKPVDESILTGPQDDFPDGGFRAWSVAAGASGVLFSTFGYANAFGYAFYTLLFHSTKLIIYSVCSKSTIHSISSPTSHHLQYPGLAHFRFSSCSLAICLEDPSSIDMER